MKRSKIIKPQLKAITSVFQSSSHLTESELIDRTSECPICRSTQPRTTVGQIQNEPDVFLLACPLCRGMSASHMPTDEALQRYYAQYYANNPESHTFHNINRLAAHLARYVKPDSQKSSLHIIDFGGGDGELSIQLAKILINSRQDLTVEITVVDYHKADYPEIPNIAIKHAADLQEIESPADIFIASAILEHIPQIRNAMENMFKCTGAGGYIYARTPYISPFMSIMPNYDFTYPGHVHDLGDSFWNRVIQTFGLKAEYIVSQPSIIETIFAKAPLRTSISFLCKTIARAEKLIRPSAIDLKWKYVGGWEVVLKKL